MFLLVTQKLGATTVNVTNQWQRYSSRQTLKSNSGPQHANVTFVPFRSVMTTVCLLETLLQQSPDQSWQTAPALREVKREPAPTEGVLWGLMEAASVPPVSTHPPPAD